MISSHFPKGTMKTNASIANAAARPSGVVRSPSPASGDENGAEWTSKALGGKSTGTKRKKSAAGRKGQGAKLPKLGGDAKKERDVNAGIPPKIKEDLGALTDDSSGKLAKSEEKDDVPILADKDEDVIVIDSDSETKEVKVGTKVGAENIPEKYKCGGSGRLMVYPVVMKDGKYDKKLVDDRAKDFKNKGKQFRSPKTKKVMDKKYMRDRDLEKEIHDLIDSNSFDKDIIDDWKRRKTEADADAGDMTAIVDMGQNYEKGLHSYKIDCVQAYKWYLKAALKDDPKGLVCAARCLLKGIGVKKNNVEAIHFLTIAAYKNNGHANYSLGKYYLQGKHGLAPNEEKAKKYLSIVCKQKHDKHSISEKKYHNAIALTREMD